MYIPVQIPCGLIYQRCPFLQKFFREKKVTTSAGFSTLFLGSKSDSIGPGKFTTFLRGGVPPLRTPLPGGGQNFTDFGTPPWGGTFYRFRPPSGGGHFYRFWTPSKIPFFWLKKKARDVRGTTSAHPHKHSFMGPLVWFHNFLMMGPNPSSKRILTHCSIGVEQRVH